MKGRRICHFERRFVAVALIGMLLAAPALARAAEYTDEDSNPFRIVYYLVYPFGKALEYTVTRPLHAASWYVAPFHHIDEKHPNDCSRERPARRCTKSIH